MAQESLGIEHELAEFMAEWESASPLMLVHTSGSTGKPKPMYVEKKRMMASARITCDFLGLKPGDTALLCMPLKYIAGKMMVVRSIVRHMRLITVEPSGRPLRGLTDAPVFAAMTPMQVYNSLREPDDRIVLGGIRHLIIGGGAIDDTMAAELRDFTNDVWSTYGMTETLSHIALMRMSGMDADKWYTPLSGVTVGLSTQGCLTIDAPEVCPTHIVTNDVAEMAADGRRFRIVGRADNVINSGGVKIQIEEVEAMIRRHTSSQFIITKKKDDRFGEIVVILVERGNASLLSQLCRSVLPKYWQPRLVISLDSLPVTETGKPARALAQKIAAGYGT